MGNKTVVAPIAAEGYAQTVRVWDLAPERLCRAHLLGEHRELHAIWSVLTGDKTGYRQHPETLRWEERLAALYARHTALVEEMRARGYKHASPLDARLATGAAVQDRYVDPPDVQIAILRSKGCGCAV
jgi:hypothetical protein